LVRVAGKNREIAKKRPSGRFFAFFSCIYQKKAVLLQAKKTLSSGQLKQLT